MIFKKQNCLKNAGAGAGAENEKIAGSGNPAKNSILFRFLLAAPYSAQT